MNPLRVPGSRNGSRHFARAETRCYDVVIRPLSRKRFARRKLCNRLGSLNTAFAVEIDLDICFGVVFRIIVFNIIAATERKEKARRVPRHVDRPADRFIFALAYRNDRFKRARLLFVGYNRLIVKQKVSVIRSIRIAVHLFLRRAPGKGTGLHRVNAVIGFYLVEEHPAQLRKPACT